MSWINMKSRRSFDFAAPYNEEGERVVTIPFPIAVNREVTDTGIVHDANPAVVTVSPAAAETIEVETKVQAGSLLIIRNEGTAKVTIGDVDCDAPGVTTLMWDGNGYFKMGNTAI